MDSEGIKGTASETPPPSFRLPGGTILDWQGPPLVMAIINCTPDSFYPPSRNVEGSAALERALAAEAAGAHIVDFGGESSRPGAEYVDEAEELRRILPVIRAFRRQSRLPVSVDTRKAAVARAALDAGADIINDISALEDDPALAGVCSAVGAAVVLMHKRGIPRTMQEAPPYEDVAAEVSAYLWKAAARAEEAGIGRGGIILDPGIGFGKTLADNLALLAHLAEMCTQGYPFLVGLSRKRFVGELTGRELEGRLAGTLGASAAALAAGASILRVHDVEETVDFVKVFYASRNQGKKV